MNVECLAGGHFETWEAEIQIISLLVRGLLNLLHEPQLRVDVKEQGLEIDLSLGRKVVNNYVSSEMVLLPCTVL